MHQVFHCNYEGAEKNGKDSGSTMCARARVHEFCCQVNCLGSVISELCLRTFLSLRIIIILTLQVIECFDPDNDIIVSYRIVFLP